MNLEKYSKRSDGTRSTVAIPTPARLADQRRQRRKENRMENENNNDNNNNNDNDNNKNDKNGSFDNMNEQRKFDTPNNSKINDKPLQLAPAQDNHHQQSDNNNNNNRQKRYTTNNRTTHRHEGTSNIHQSPDVSPGAEPVAGIHANIRPVVHQNPSIRTSNDNNINDNNSAVLVTATEVVDDSNVHDLVANLQQRLNQQEQLLQQQQRQQTNYDANNNDNDNFDDNYNHIVEAVAVPKGDNDDNHYDNNSTRKLIQVVILSFCIGAGVVGIVVAILLTRSNDGGTSPSDLNIMMPTSVPIFSPREPTLKPDTTEPVLTLSPSIAFNPTIGTVSPQADTTPKPTISKYPTLSPTTSTAGAAPSPAPTDSSFLMPTPTRTTSPTISFSPTPLPSAGVSTRIPSARPSSGFSEKLALINELIALDTNLNTDILTGNSLQTPQSRAIDWMLFNPTAQTPIQKLEQFVILTLYYSNSNFNDWIEKSPFLISSNTDTCDWNNGLSWFGIYCNDQVPKRISRLSFELSLLLPVGPLFPSNVRFAGTLPTEIGLLSQLTELEFVHNRLEGTLPSEVGNLHNLSILSLGGNSMEGDLPTQLFAMPSLSRLELYSNSFQGKLPYVISLPQIKIFSIRNNQLTGSIPNLSSFSASIENIRFENNEFSGTIGIAEGINHLSNLMTFRLDGNLLSGSLPSHLGSLLNLNSLNLANNGFIGEIPPEIGDLQMLSDLNLGRNNFSGTIPDSVIWITDLQSLDISYNPSITGSIPDSLNFMTNLSNLLIEGTSLFGSIDLCSIGSTVVQANCLSNDITCYCCSICCDSLGNNCITCTLATRQETIDSQCPAGP